MAYYPGYQYQQPFSAYQQGYAQMQQPIQQPIQQPVQQTPAQIQTTPQIQNGGFVSVRNEMEARNYAVAPGNSVTFKDENAPYVYTKTMGFSQLDRPIFERYKLVKEEVDQTLYEAQTATENAQAKIPTDYVKRDEFEAVTAQIEALHKQIDALSEQISQKPAAKAKKEAKEDAEP